jgi:Domain of unknown function (DUF4760)
MSHFKRIFNLKNPLPWYYYFIYILLLFLIILAISIFLCGILYLGRDTVSSIFDKASVDKSFISRKGFLSTYALIVTMVATMTGLTGPALAVYWSIRQDNRTVIDLTYSLIKEWREPTITEAAYKLNEYFDNPEQYERKRFALYDFAQKDENKDLRVSIKIILNYLEAVSAACYNSHADNDLIRNYFEALYFSYNHRLEPYINSIRNKPQHSNIPNHLRKGIYCMFTDLARDWTETTLQFNR